jgi:hypothetical protein
MPAESPEVGAQSPFARSPSNDLAAGRRRQGLVFARRRNLIASLVAEISPPPTLIVNAEPLYVQIASGDVDDDQFIRLSHAAAPTGDQAQAPSLGAP